MNNVKINAHLWHIFNEFIELVKHNISQNQRLDDKKQAEFLEELSRITIKEEEIEEWLTAHTYQYPNNCGKI